MAIEKNGHFGLGRIKDFIRPGGSGGETQMARCLRQVGLTTRNRCDPPKRHVVSLRKQPSPLCKISLVFSAS